MGGAPSRETLVRYIVRSASTGGCTASTTGRSDSRDSTNASDPSIHAPAAMWQHPEVILIPLITDYFPSCTSPLFQQLLCVRREPNVAYYYRDARSRSSAETVVQGEMGSDKDIYNWYMSLSEQRLVETDNELIALSRAGRVVSPVPCAVAFVYQSSSTTVAAVSAADAGVRLTNVSTVGSPTSSKKKSTFHGKVNRQGRGGCPSTSNGYMTMENTVRLSNVNLRVRIFGFVGDTRFCPASMQLSQATKLPMCFTIFLSRSAGGNHRAQVTLLAAHTYITQMQALGILRTHDQASVLQGGRTQESLMRTGLDAKTLGNDTDPLAALRLDGSTDTQGAASAYRDSYLDPYDEDFSAGRDPYNITDRCCGVKKQSSFSRMTDVVSGKESRMYLKGLGTTPILAAEHVAKETVLRRPIEIFVHRADVPALCYLREMRALMDQSSVQASSSAIEKKQEILSLFSENSAESRPATVPESCGDRYEEGRGGDVKPALAQENTKLCGSCTITKQDRAEASDTYMNIRVVGTSGECSAADTEAESLKRQLQTVIRAEELHGSVAAGSMGRILLWASDFYTQHFKKLVGGEAAKLRQELAQRNLAENPLEGVLSLAEGEPRPPKVTPQVGDVWIPPDEAYVEVYGTDGGGRGRGWAKLTAGAVLRYVGRAPLSSSGPTPCNYWRVSPNEFAEDLLLSLSRQACQASRRASPTDSHWLMSRKTGLLEGLEVGFLVWREVCAGQKVIYGTTPEFLKKWIQSGADVTKAYRNHVDRMNNKKEDTTAAEITAADATTEREEADAETERKSFPVNVFSSTAFSRGLCGVNERGLPLNTTGESGANNKSVDSGGRSGKRSDPSSMGLYNAHSGFISTPEQEMTSSLPGPAEVCGNHADDKTKSKRVRADVPSGASSLVTSSVGADRVAQQRCVSETSRVEGMPGHSLPVPVEPLRFSIPAMPSSVTSEQTPSLSLFGTPKCYAKMSLSGASTDSRSCVSVGRQPLSKHMLAPCAATACWLDYPNASPVDDADVPSVNVVVRQRRRVRGTPTSSANFGTSISAPRTHRGSHCFYTPHSEAINLPIGAQSNMFSPFSGASFDLSIQPTETAHSPVRGSLPVRVSETCGPSSEGRFFRQGGHSPTPVKQSRSLLCAETVLLSRSCSCHGAAGVGDAPQLQPQRSAAIVVGSGDTMGGTFSSSSQVATPSQWATMNMARPSSMRGASITFASGSASSAHSRHALLSHTTRHTKHCQPVASSSPSLPAPEQPESRICENNSQKLSSVLLRPPPFSFTGKDDGASANMSVHSPVRRSSADPAHRGCGGVFASRISGCIPVVGVVDVSVASHPGSEEMGALPSGYSSSVHTPCQSGVVSSAKSSVGSGKYRWNWRSISWTA